MRRSASIRSGFSIPELLIAMVVLGVVGTASLRLFLGQARFFERQNAEREARSVSRASLNMLLSEMRMVEASGGVVAATATSLTLRVPFALGVVCSTSGTVTSVSLLPADSAMRAEAGFSGYAWRNGAAVYSYVENGASLTTGSTAACNAASITTLPGGSVIGVSPALPVGTPPGTAVLLYRRITYEIAPSTAIPGRLALWRRVLSSNTSEELAAPFDENVRFRFYTTGTSAPSDAVPPLTTIRGVELQMIGASERAPRGTSAPRTASTTSAVFFRNRL